jgi:hypothetical protein
MTPGDLDDLVAEGVIIRVKPDAEAARADLGVARAHLASAPLTAAVDPVGAFSIAYDAVRKALVAHMRANGVRVRSGVGAHYQTGRYGLAALNGRGADDALRVPPPDVIAQEIVEDLEAALAEFSTVAESLGQPPTS